MNGVSDSFEVMQNMGNEEFNDEKIPKEAEEEDKAAKVTKRKEEMTRRQMELIKRGKEKDISRRSLIERNEAEQEDIIIRAEEIQELKFLQARQTQKLAEELLRRKNNEIREQKLRQLLKNDSIELRRLGDDIRVAYAAKAAKSQLLEQKTSRQNSKSRGIVEDLMIQGWYKDDRFEKQEMLEARLKQEQYRKDLHNQLGFNHLMRQQKVKEFQRKSVEDTLTLGGDDSENQRRKRERASHLLAEQKAFLEAQKARKLMEKQHTLKEEEERANILADKMMKENQSKKAKSIIVASKEAILAKMTEKILSEQRARQEREDAIKELLEEEEKNLLENYSKEEALKKIQTAKEMMEDMKHQHILKQESKVVQEKIDREFAKYLDRERDKFLMEDKRTDEERRARAIQYGKDLREAIETARLRYTQGILRNQATLRKDQMIDEEKKKSTEAERSKMLREHGIHLSGFLNLSH